MKKLWIVIGIVVIVFLSIFPVTAQTKKEPGVIKIGAILPLSGNTAWLGEQHKWGLDLAIEDINSRGGIKGRKLKIIYEDDKGEALMAVSAFNRLLTFNKLSLVISAMSSSAMAIIPIAEEKKVVLYANATHPEIADKSIWTFRNFLTSTQEAEVMAKISVDKLNIRELALLYIDDVYGEGGKNVFRKFYTRFGGKLLTMEKYQKDGTDFRAEITKILNVKPKAIYIFGYGNSTVILLRQLKEAGYRGTILGTNNFSGPPISETGSEILEGSIFTSPYFSSEISDKQIQEFVKRIKEKSGGKDPQWNTAVEYDAIFIIAKALGLVQEVSGPKLREALEKVGDFVGIAGRYKYYPNGERRLQLTVRTYKAGKQVSYE